MMPKFKPVASTHSIHTQYIIVLHYTCREYCIVRQDPPAAESAVDGFYKGCFFLPQTKRTL